MEAHELSRRQLHMAPSGVTLAIDTDAPRGARGVAEVEAAFRCLSDVVRPLELVAELEAVDPELGIVLEPVDLPGPYHLLRDELPDGVVPRARLPGPIAEERVMSPEAIGEWLRRALDSQTAAAGESETAWSQITMTAARVRYPGPLGVELVLENLESQPFRVPISSDPDGSWLAGPTAESSMDPPLRVTIAQEGHRTRLSLAVVWPLWSERGTPGHSLLVSCVKRLIDAGWQVERADQSHLPARVHK